MLYTSLFHRIKKKEQQPVNTSNEKYSINNSKIYSANNVLQLIGANTFLARRVRNP